MNPKTIMGKILSVLSRPLRNYNVGNRAQKRITADKPQPAPRHPSTVKYLRETIDSQSSKEATKIPQEFLSKLKNVYVTSQGKGAADDDSSRKLPQSRELVLDPEFGFLEPPVIPPGKISMRQAVEILLRHQEKPNEWTPQIISKEYKLDVGTTQQFLLYFRAYEMWQPPQKSTKNQTESVKKYVIPPKPLPEIE